MPRTPATTAATPPNVSDTCGLGKPAASAHAPATASYVNLEIVALLETLKSPVHSVSAFSNAMEPSGVAVRGVLRLGTHVKVCPGVARSVSLATPAVVVAAHRTPSCSTIWRDEWPVLTVRLPESTPAAPTRTVRMPLEPATSSTSPAPALAAATARRLVVVSVYDATISNTPAPESRPMALVLKRVGATAASRAMLQQGTSTCAPSTVREMTLSVLEGVTTQPPSTPTGSAMDCSSVPAGVYSSRNASRTTLL